MIRSMTAFGRLESEQDSGSYTWEMRSVNHRYLEVSTRLPENFRDLDPAIREFLRKRLSRGKVEVTLKVAANVKNQTALTINEDFADQLIEATTELYKRITHSAEVNPIDILRWPGVMETSTGDLEAMHQDAMEQFSQLVDQFVANREREGAELKQLITSRIEEVANQVAVVKPRIPELVEAQRNKLRNRVEEAGVQYDPERLEQEIVLLAQRIDVEEELDRLMTHVEEVKRVLDKGGPAGRRLDFLMQELNREANTLASKSIDAQSTQIAVELKVLIEQMREQVQNIE